MRINNLAAISPGDVYYSTGFRNTLESYIPTILSRPDTVIVNLDPHDVYEYEFDFYGLLRVAGIPERLRWIVMRLNGIHSPTNFPTDISSVYVPSDSFIERIKQIHLGIEKKLSSS